MSSPRLAANPCAGYPPQSQNQWLNDPLLVHLVRPAPTRTRLSRNHSHLTGAVVANVVVPAVGYVRCGAHYGYWPIGARRVGVSASWAW